MKDKVGLITIHDTQNWGSLAQTIGTYKALEQIGVDVELIDYKCKAIYEREYQPLYTVGLNPFKFLVWILRLNEKKHKLRNYRDFLRRQCRLSKQFDINNISQSNSLYQTFLVGSDIVWGFKTTGHDLSYMLDFADSNKRKLAFSASVGNNWNDKDKIIVKELLSRFDSISVRENEASIWVGELLKKQPLVTCDPTTLMDVNYWNQHRLDNSIPKEKYVLTYMGSDDHQNIYDAQEYAEKHNLSVYEMGGSKRHFKGVKKINPTTFGQWLSLMANSEMTFTGSFHGLMFSLYFHRPFYYYYRGHSNSRLESIARDCRVEHRLGTQANIANNKLIDFNYVDKVLEQKRQSSFDYLKQCFNIHD